MFAWLERSRAQAFRVRPVRPPADPQAAAVLAELRQLSLPDPGGRAERQPRPGAWSPGKPSCSARSGSTTGRPSGLGEATAQASLGEVSAALEESGQTLVGILARSGEMVAVVVGRGPARLVRLGDFEAAAEAARRLNADLDTLAGRRLPARLEAVIRESIRHQADTLTAEIIAPLRSSLGDGGIVFVPAGPLASIPWGVLPDLRGRPVTVCPSASSWLAAWRRGQAAAARPPAGPPLLVAGPDLEHAAREVTEIARFYPGCRPLLAERPRSAPRCGPSTAPRSPTWPRTGTTTRRTSCSPGSTWPTAR